MPDTTKKILVIKLSALGDFAQALGAMRAIRKHHKDSHITLMTTKLFKNFGEDCGYFDEVWLHNKPKMLQVGQWIALRNDLNNGHYDRVYDLQNNDRTALYLSLFNKKPQWFGMAKKASHRNTVSSKATDHAFDRHKQTLKLAGIENVDVDPMDWVQSDIERLNLNKPYVLLVPGSSPQHPYKRWSVENYAAVARYLKDNNFTPILLGTDIEKPIASDIKAIEPSCIDLTGETSIYDVIALGRDAAACIGNDSGPTQLITPTGCKTIALYSGHSDPVRHRPLGANVYTIQKDDVNDIDVKQVIETFASLNVG